MSGGEDKHDRQRKNLGGFSHLASMTRAAQYRETEFDLPAEETDEIDDTPTEGDTASKDPCEALVTAAMAAAVTPAVTEALARPSAQAVIVSAPSAAWIPPLKRFFEKRAFGRKWSCVARDGSDRRAHKPSAGNREVACDLAAGRSVVGIAIAPEQVLPKTLIGAADVRLAMKLEAGIVDGAIRKIYGDGTASPLDKRDIAGLDLDDLVAAMRPEASVQDVMARLSAAARTRAREVGADDVPDLETAAEFGAAREWGLALARDMRDYRAGLLSWSGVDRGAVFHSDPGMGKSVLARSIAAACEATLVVGSVGELFASSSGHLDGVIKAMRELFARAIAAAPAILFLDEIDGVPSRESLDSRNRDFWMPVIEDFLLLLDDATSARREGVVVIGATNRIEAVDPAILRPGRLERAIEIAAPGPDGILNMLRFHVRDGLPEDQLRTVTDLFDGFTAAEIMETVRSARRRARVVRRALSLADLKDAALPMPTVPPDVLKRIAVHEAGHVVVASVCGLGTVRYVRIGGRNGLGGVTSIDPASTDLVTRHSIERQVVGILAGRAAEMVLLGSASAGSGGSDRSDLAMATRLLASMELSYGLGENGVVYLGDADEALRELRRNPAVRRGIDETLRRLQTRACEIVEQHRVQVSVVAEALLRLRFLSGKAIQGLLTLPRTETTRTPDDVYPGGLR